MTPHRHANRLHWECPSGASPSRPVARGFPTLQTCLPLILCLGGVAHAAEPPPAVSALCGASVSVADLAGVLDSAEEAYADIDRQGVLDVIDQMGAILACVDSPLPGPLISRIHRVRGLGYFLEQDDAATVRAFAAARRADPSAELSEAIAPVGNILHTRFMEYALEGMTFTRVQADIAGGRVFVDGVETDMKPDAIPSLLQVVTQEGRVVQTAWLPVGAPLPAGVVVVPDEPTVEVLLPPPDSTRWILATGAGGAFLASGALYALSHRAGVLHDEATTIPDLDRQYSLNHGFVLASAGAAILGAGLGTVLVIHW